MGKPSFSPEPSGKSAQKIPDVVLPDPPRFLGKWAFIEIEFSSFPAHQSGKLFYLPVPWVVHSSTMGFTPEKWNMLNPQK